MANRIIIPSSFTLGHRTWNVSRMSAEEYAEWIAAGPPVCSYCGNKESPESAWHADSGCCSLAHSRIVLVKENWGENTKSTYYHELAHALWFGMGKIDDKDHPSEQDTELLGNLLYQYELTRKGSVRL